MPFRDIIGHRKLVSLLSRSAERAEVPPSLIFAGPAGIGKHAVAVATAQALNCLQPRRSSSDGNMPSVPYDACGACTACQRIVRGAHPDVLLIGPGENGSIKIEVVRDVIERTAYRPFEGRQRVVIFDDADALVSAAQNALLKTLEEPPSASTFLLVTARPDALLPTVLSRCPRLRFRPLPAGDLIAALVQRGKTEAQARALAASADGSLGRALAANVDEIVEARDVAIRVLTQAAATDDPRRRLESAKDLLENTGGGGAGDRDQLSAHLRAISSLLRDIQMLHVDQDRAGLANADMIPMLERLTAFRGDRGQRAFAAIDAALEALDRNSGVKIVADWVAVSI